MQGYYREEHLFALKQALELYDIYQDKLIDCDKKIEVLLCLFESKVDEAGLSQLEKASKKYKTNAPSFDLHKEVYRMTGVNFNTLPGISSYSVFKIISETGLDMSCWQSEKHFAPWLGLCPGNRTGVKVRALEGSHLFYAFQLHYTVAI